MRDPRLAAFRWPLGAFALMMALVAASAAVLFARKLGFAAERVQAFYLGSEAAFSSPRSLQGLLEVAVPHLGAIPLSLLVTLHLVGFAAVVPRRLFALLGGAAFGSALAGIGAGFAVRFLWPSLAWAKIAAFVGFEAILLVWLGLLGALLVRPAGAAGAAEIAPGGGGGPSDRGAPGPGPGARAARAGRGALTARGAARRGVPPARAIRRPGSPP